MGNAAWPIFESTSGAVKFNYATFLGEVNEMNESTARTMIGKKVTYYKRELEVLNVVPHDMFGSPKTCFKILLEDCRFVLEPITSFEIQEGKVVMK